MASVGPVVSENLQIFCSEHNTEAIRGINEEKCNVQELTVPHIIEELLPFVSFSHFKFGWSTTTTCIKGIKLEMSMEDRSPDEERYSVQ